MKVNNDLIVLLFIGDSLGLFRLFRFCSVFLEKAIEWQLFMLLFRSMDVSEFLLRFCSILVPFVPLFLKVVLIPSGIADGHVPVLAVLEWNGTKGWVIAGD